MREESLSTGLLGLEEIEDGDMGLVGPKATNLARIMAADFPVPSGFVVIVSEYETALARSELAKRIEEVLGQVEFEDPKSVQTASRAIKEMVMGLELRKDMSEALSKRLNVASGALWAVRSSAIAEDLGDASFAGQQDTYLSVPAERVAGHIQKCWASYWNERALQYRHDNAVPHLRSGIAVIVQRMVDARTSGIMFTKDPVSGEAKVIVESSFGLGEAIASGLVSPDRYECEGQDCHVVRQQINRKERAFFLGRHSDEGEELREELKGKASLTSEEAGRLASLGLKLEGLFDAPQDVEWAIENDDLYVLQSRAITTLSKDNTLWTRAYGDEYWADVTSPLFFSLLGEYLTKYVNHEGSAIMGYKDLTDKELLRVHKGHIYFNSEVLEEVFTYNPKFSRTKELLNYFPIKDQDRIANAKTRLAKRVVAELRIAILDNDGVIFRTHKAYDKWAVGFMEVAKQFDSLDLTTLPDEDLEKQFRILEKAYLKHFRLIRYGMVTHSIGMNLMIKRWLSDWLNDRNGVLYSKVISGLKGNKTIETNIALAKLADVARKDERVKRDLLELPANDLLRKMSSEPSMVPFKKEYSAFMAEYGQRSHTREIYFPRWSDDPALVVDILRSLVRSPELDLEEVERKKVQERLEVEKDILERVGKMKYGFARRFLFKTILRYAQVYLMFRENQRFYLDHILARWRRLFLEYGRRFVERGWTDTLDDVFFLSKEEIFARVKEDTGSFQERIKERRAEFNLYRDRLPPKFLRGRSEFDDTVIWQGNVLKISGTSASPGTCTGIVRVVESIEQLGTVQDQEVLVTSNTDPGWTAVFSKIGGLITETGGILSHGAVVSREYGIPAVTAVKGATKIFKTGQRITLDGNEGTIYVLEG